ncbi:hypothetical protein ACFV3R_25260 [Streptomyces sp. NPDC059740]|uniref:hypothetical protein n=1 Tax=Streptomyces sp. NPDC059740 TaxID=3346926 RepID=UPI00364C3245
MPITAIPEVDNHTSLLQALGVIRLEVECRQEDVNNLAAWSGEISERMQGVTAELAALNVDATTIGNIAMLADTLAGSTSSAVAYKAATDTSVQQAEVAARTARRGHDLIQAAVDDAEVPMAKNSFYAAE